MNRIQELIKELCPNGVEWKKLGEICSVYDGTHQTPKYVEDGIPFISVENIKDIYNSKKYISKEAFDAYKIKPQIGDVFLTRIGTIGACAVFNKQEDIAYYVSLALLRPSNTLNSYYLKYILESSIGVAELRKRTLINAVPIKVNKEEIGKIEIPVPPLPVQTEIVRILDKFVEQQEQLEKLIELRTKQYEYYSHKAYFDLIEKGIKQKCLGEFCDLLSGNPFDSNLMANNGIRLMRGMNIKRGVLDFSEDLNKYWHTDKGLEKFYLNKNDIVISMDGSLVGRSFAYIEEKHLPLLLVQRVARIRMKNDNPKFLYHYLANGYFADYVDLKKTAGAIPHISMKDISSFQIPLPDIDTQKRIADALDNFESSISALTSALELSKKRYEHYRDEMLKF